MRGFWKLATVAYITTITGIAIGSIGHPGTGTPVGWSTVFAVAAFMTVPAIWGYLAGKEDAEHKAPNTQGERQP